MAQLQTTAEEEKHNTYRSTSPIAPPVEEASPSSETVKAASLDEIPITARQVRPDELMAALAAIDARKNNTIAGTVSIGDALERMQADTTPEEVWQEIYTGRLRQRKSNTAQGLDAQQQRKRFWTIGGSLAGVFAVALGLRLLVGNVQQGTVNKPLSSLPNPSTINTKPPPLNYVQVPSPLQYRSPNSVSLTQFLRGDRVLRMDLYTIIAIKTMVYGSPSFLPLPIAKRDHVFLAPPPGTQGDFLVYMHDGRLYLRGWIEEKPGQDSARMLVQKFSFYNRSDNPALAGKSIRQITIPADGIQDYASSSDGTQHVIKMRLNHLDGEAWKTWEAPPLPEYSGIASSHSGTEL